jgi:hypothetical protein
MGFYMRLGHKHGSRPATLAIIASCSGILDRYGLFLFFLPEFFFWRIFWRIYGRIVFRKGAPNMFLLLRACGI